MELKEKIKNIKKKQEEEIAKYIGDIGKYTNLIFYELLYLIFFFRTHKPWCGTSSKQRRWLR